MLHVRGLNDFLLSFLHFSMPVLAIFSAGTRKSGSDASFLSSGRALFFRSASAESFLPSTGKSICSKNAFLHRYHPGAQHHVKVKSKANPFLPEFDKYFFKRTKWREDLAKECKQVTTFVMQETINHGRVSLRRDSLKRA